MRQEDNAMSHLTLADRSEIENGLRSNRGFGAIARTSSKARSTVMREILSHRIPSDKARRGVSRTSASTAAGATGDTCAHSASTP